MSAVSHGAWINLKPPCWCGRSRPALLHHFQVRTPYFGLLWLKGNPAKHRGNAEMSRWLNEVAQMMMQLRDLMMPAQGMWWGPMAGSKAGLFYWPPPVSGNCWSSTLQSLSGLILRRHSVLSVPGFYVQGYLHQLSHPLQGWLLREWVTGLHLSSMQRVPAFHKIKDQKFSTAFVSTESKSIEIKELTPTARLRTPQRVCEVWVTMGAFGMPPHFFKTFGFPNAAWCTGTVSQEAFSSFGLISRG